MPRPAESALSAILLAGGRGSRMGGIEKALLRRADKTQLQRWISELHGRDVRTVVVGSASLRGKLHASVPLVQESPAYAGPAAGILAGAAELFPSDRLEPSGLRRQGWTLLLAVDLAEPRRLLDWLIDQLGTDAAGAAAVLPTDETGRHQYLSCAVPTEWLMRRAARLTAAEVQDRPVRWLLSGLQDSAGLSRPVIPPGVGEDVDTIEDARRLGVGLP